MPNPKCTRAASDRALPPEPHHFLRRVGGEYIVWGHLMLPPAETAPEETMSVVLDVGHNSRVRSHYRRTLMKHRKSSDWAWLAAPTEPEPKDPAAAGRVRVG